MRLNLATYNGTDRLKLQELAVGVGEVNCGVSRHVAHLAAKEGPEVPVYQHAAFTVDTPTYLFLRVALRHKAKNSEDLESSHTVHRK